MVEKDTVVKYASIQIRRYMNLANLCMQNGRTFIMMGKVHYPVQADNPCYKMFVYFYSQYAMNKVPIVPDTVLPWFYQNRYDQNLYRLLWNGIYTHAASRFESKMAAALTMYTLFFVFMCEFLWTRGDLLRKKKNVNVKW